MNVMGTWGTAGHTDKLSNLATYQPVYILEQPGRHGAITRVSWPWQAEGDDKGTDSHVRAVQVGKLQDAVNHSGGVVQKCKS